MTLKSVLVLGVLALAPSTALRSFEATVTRTLSAADDNFGGCMVALSEVPSDHGLNCPGTSTGSRSAAPDPRQQGERHADVRRGRAQLAFATGRSRRPAGFGAQLTMEKT